MFSATRLGGHMPASWFIRSSLLRMYLMVHVGYSFCLAERLQIRLKAMRRSIKGTGVWWYNSCWYIHSLFCSAKGNIIMHFYQLAIISCNCMRAYQYKRV